MKCTLYISEKLKITLHSDLSTTVYLRHKTISNLATLSSYMKPLMNGYLNFLRD